MGKTYKVDTAKLDEYIRQINALKENLSKTTKPTVNASRCQGAMKDEVDRVANDLNTMKTLYQNLLTRTANCLTTFRNSVESNDQQASQDVRN